jgi:HK97 family phage portal protein
MPSFIERITNAFDGFRLKSVEGVALTPRSEFKSFLDLITRSATNPQMLVDENKNWVAACVDAIAKSTAGIRFQAHTYGKNGQVETVREHPVLDLLSFVNNHMSQFELFEITSSHLSIFGNAIWLLDGVDDDGKGKPTAIYPLNPKYIKIRRTTLPQLIEAYEYTIENKTMTFKPARIIHIRDTNPDDPLWGMGKLEKSFDSIEADMFTRLWAKAFFKNGAKVDGVIEVPTAISAEQAKILLEVFNQKHQGVGRSHKTAIIPMGGKLVQNGANIKDMDFANLRQVSRDEILALFGVPKSILGIVDDVNRANAEASNYVFADRTIKPYMQKITDTINEFLVPFYGENMWLTFVDPVPENRIEQLEIDKAALGGKPFMSVNEVRQRYNLAPIENGNDVMTDFSSVPLGQPIPETIPKSVTPRGKAAVKAQKQKQATEKVAAHLLDGIKANIAKKKEQVDVDAAEWKRFAVTVAPYIKAVEKGLKGIAKDEKATVLEKLPNVAKGMSERVALGDPKIKVVDVGELVDDDEAVKVISNMLKPIYQELTEKEGKAVLAQITGAAFDARTERVQAGLSHAIGLLSREYTKTTKSKLQDTLEEGLANGESMDDLAGRISDVYKGIEDHRAYAVAYTETNRTGNFAAKEAMKQSGVVKTVRWYTAGDPCPFCDSMSGQVEDINSAFFEKGDTLTVEGSDGESSIELNYDDIENPPLHTNCQCYIRPDEISL